MEGNRNLRILSTDHKKNQISKREEKDKTENLDNIRKIKKIVSRVGKWNAEK